MPMNNNRLRLALVRHGESQNNVKESTGSEVVYWRERDPDPALTDRGMQQAELLAKHLADPVKSQFLGMHPLSELWCSPVKRAMQTIQPLSRTPVVRTNGPYYGKDRSGKPLLGGSAAYRDASQNQKMSCYSNSLADGEERYGILKPIVKTLAYEEGGLYHADISVVANAESGKDEVVFNKYDVVAGLSKRQMTEEFPGYVTDQTDGPPITEHGWYVAADPQSARESEHLTLARAYEFATMLKDRARHNFQETQSKPGGLPIKAENILLVAHYDFIAHLLNALLHHDTIFKEKPSKKMKLPSPADPESKLGYWRHFNTAVTVVDICGEDGKVDVVRSNVIDHLAEDPNMVSGFPLGYYSFS